MKDFCNPERCCGQEPTVIGHLAPSRPCCHMLSYNTDVLTLPHSHCLLCLFLPYIFFKVPNSFTNLGGVGDRSAHSRKHLSETAYYDDNGTGGPLTQPSRLGFIGKNSTARDFS